MNASAVRTAYGALAREAPLASTGRLLHGVRLLPRGRRWSDHPSCTHPLLAQVARLVNDLISDEGRQGWCRHSLGGGSAWRRPHLDHAAGGRGRCVILEVPEPNQRVLAAGLLSAHQVAPRRDPTSRTPGCGPGPRWTWSGRGRVARAAPGPGADLAEDLRQALRTDDDPLCRRRARGERHRRLRRSPENPARDGDQRLSRADDGTPRSGRRGGAVGPIRDLGISRRRISRRGGLGRRGSRCRARPPGRRRAARRPSRRRRGATESRPSPGRASVTDSSGAGSARSASAGVDLGAHERVQGAEVAAQHDDLGG